jgi:hypothetical protein
MTSFLILQVQFKTFERIPLGACLKTRDDDRSLTVAALKRTLSRLPLVSVLKAHSHYFAAPSDHGGVTPIMRA